MCVLCQCRYIVMHFIPTKRVLREIWRQQRDYRDVIGQQLKHDTLSHIYAEHSTKIPKTKNIETFIRVE